MDHVTKEQGQHVYLHCRFSYWKERKDWKKIEMSCWRIEDEAWSPEFPTSQFLLQTEGNNCCQEESIFHPRVFLTTKSYNLAWQNQRMALCPVLGQKKARWETYL